MVMPAGPFQAFAEAAVNLLNNHINPGQQAAHQVNRPSFQSLRQNGVVGVGNGVGGNLPGLVPTQSQIIHQHAHQLRHAQGRVRIVDVDSHPFGHLRPSVVAVALAITPDNRANASRGKEIFLVQTQSLAGIAGVVRVKHRSQSANFIAVAHCAAVIAPVKGLQIKAFLQGSSVPQAQFVHGFAVPAHNRHIIRNSRHRLVAVVLKGQLAVLPATLSHAAQAHLNHIILVAQLPGIRLGQPSVRLLGLAASLNLLAEQTVIVAQTHTITGITQTSQ